MKKHAICILAHKNWEQLDDLIDTLGCEYADVFLHIDKKRRNRKRVTLRLNTATKELIKMFNLFSFLKNMTLSKKEAKRKRVFALWDEIEECEQAYEHKKKLGEEMLALAQQIDDSDLPSTEKITKKEIYLNAARDNFDKADNYNQRLDDLTKELQLAMK